MINVAIIHSVSDFYSGATYSLVTLVKELKNSPKFNPIVYLPSKNSVLEKYLNNIGIECVAFPFHDYWISRVDENLIKTSLKRILGPINTKIKFKKIKNSLYNHHIALVHVNMLTCGGIGYVAEKIGIPVIWHIREFMEEDLKIKFVNQEREQSIIGKSNRIIAVSKAVKNKYSKIIKKNIDVVYDGVYSDLKKDIQKEILNHSIINIAVVGRIIEEKGQLLVLESLEELYKDHKINYKLHIIGKSRQDEYLAKIKRYVKSQHAESRVNFLGHIDNVIEYLEQNIDILVMSSYKEAFGRVTAEGMLAGCLIIGANSGGTVELLENGKLGKMFEPNDINDLKDAILAVTSNKVIFRDVAIKAQKVAKIKYSNKNNADEIIKIYNEVLFSK